MIPEPSPAPPQSVEASTELHTRARRGLGARVRRLLKILGAFLMILVGTVFVIAPFIPGWPLVVIGLTVLAAEYAWARRLLKRLPSRNKKKKNGA